MTGFRGTVGFACLAACLLASLALAVGCAAESTTPKGKIDEPRPTVWNRIWDEVTAKPDAEVDILRDAPVVQVILPDERAIYTFTKPPHPAHPGVVKQWVVEADGVVSIETEGWAAGSKEAFQRWLESFGARDEALIRRFQDDG